MMNLRELDLFDDDIHQPFFWEGGAKAALLVHGFPGTPAEVRPLARALHRQGWTVQAPLLPGFGPQIHELFTRRKEDWITAVFDAYTTLRASYDTVLLLGYSLGGAVALNVAARSAPDGLALLAPFWQIGGPVYAFLWQGIKQIFPEIQLFKHVDFSNPTVQNIFADWRRVLDLDDPQVQEALQELRVPAQFVDEVLALGEAAKAAAPAIRLPTLVVQGSEDKTISPKATHELLRSLAGRARYVEVAADHKITRPDTAVWPQIERAVLDYAARF